MLRLLTEQTPFLDHKKSESVRCTVLVTRIYDRMFNFPNQLNTIIVYYGSEVCEIHGLSFINYGSLTTDNKINGVNRILFIRKPQIVYFCFRFSKIKFGFRVLGRASATQNSEQSHNAPNN